MPYSELHRTTNGNLESTQSKMTNCSADLAFNPDNELVELVWENGQILMQGQSSRTRKSPSSYSGFPSLTSKAQEKDKGDAIGPKIGRFGPLDSVLNDFSSSLWPSGHMGLCEDYDMVSWLNDSFDDPLQHDYSSEFFPEVTGASLNALSSQNNAAPIDKNSSYSQLVRDAHLVSVHGDANPEQRNASKVMGVGLEPTRPRGSQLCSFPLQQSQASDPSFRSRDSDFLSCNANNIHQAPCGNLNQNQALTGGRPNIKMQKQGLGATKPPLQPSNNMGLMNFSHFSRPAAPFKTNLQSNSYVANPCLSRNDRLKSNDKVSATVSSNPVESTLIESTSGSTSVAAFQSQPVPMSGKVNLKPYVGKPPKESLSAEKSEAICREDQDFGQTSSFAGNTAIGMPDGEKNVEPMVASSSVCSGNNARGDSNDPNHTLKRKSRDAESEYQSEDVEEESVGVRNPAATRGGTGARRSRAAEVHNLSERKRRDRINEKMRALQELIPNCNKVDKASMLDEAIEYLKTLQLQVQIMSIGAGLYIPPLMLPTGMHTPHFSPMGVGMGMGMGMGMGVGFGMGMYDMSGARPLIQVPPMHGMRFPFPPISTSLPMMARCSPQMLGFPGQGLSMSMPHAPHVPLSGGPSIKSVSVPDVSRTADLVEAPGSAPPSSSNDPIKNTNLQMIPKASDEYSQNQMPSQCQATMKGFEESAMVQRNDQTPHISGNGDINSTNGNVT